MLTNNTMQRETTPMTKSSGLSSAALLLHVLKTGSKPQNSLDSLPRPLPMGKENLVDSAPLRKAQNESFTSEVVDNKR